MWNWLTLPLQLHYRFIYHLVMVMIQKCDQSDKETESVAGCFWTCACWKYKKKLADFGHQLAVHA